MRKIHEITQNTRAIPQKAAGVQTSRIPVILTLLAEIREKRLKKADIGQVESWKAAYRIFTALRSYSKGAKRIEALIVDSCFRQKPFTVDAVTLDYRTWLDLRISGGMTRGINSYTFEFLLLDKNSIGPVIRAEHCENCGTQSSCVEIRKTDESMQNKRHCSKNRIIVLVEEYFFVFIKDIGMFGMIKAAHQEYDEIKAKVDSIIDLDEQIA